jgi:hypothetical protein
MCGRPSCCSPIRDDSSRNRRSRRAFSLAKLPSIKQTEYPEAGSCVSVSLAPSKEVVFSIISARSRLPPPGIPKIANRSTQLAELILRELIRTAEDIDADAIIGVDYHNDGAVRIDETGVKLKRVVATGIAVKVSCAA